MIKKILNIGLGQIASLIITFIIGIIISRFYGPEGKGVVTILILIPTLISAYAGLTIEEGFLYYLGKNIISKKLFNNLLIRVLFIFSPIFILLYLTLYHFFEQYQYYWLPQLILMVALLYNNILKFSLRGVLNFKRYNLIQILEPLIVLIILGVIILIGADTKFILWAYTISYIISLSFQYSAISNKLEDNNKSEVSVSDLLKYSYKVHFFKILNFTEAKFDILLLGFFLPMSNIGIYSVSVSLAALFQAIVQTPISNVLYPILIKSKKEDQVDITLRYFKLSYFLSILFLIALVCFGDFFIVKFYGIEFSDAYIPLIILLLGSTPKASAACINSYFKAQGRPQELYKTSLYTVTINIVLCFLLIKDFGIIGASIASAVSYLSYAIVMVYKYLSTSQRTLHSLSPQKKDFVYIRNFIIKKIHN